MKIGAIAGLVVGISIALIIAAAVIPTSITNINAANTTAWGTAEVAVWGLLTVVIVLAIVMAFFKYVG